jgi:hypothetical protein
LKKTVYNIIYVPDSFDKKKLLLQHVQSERSGIACFPKRFLTSELCLEAIKKDVYQIEYIPKELRTAQIYQVIIESGKKELERYLPPKMQMFL